MATELLQREFENSKGEKVLFTTRQLSASKALELQVELIDVLGKVALPFIHNSYNFGDILALSRQSDSKATIDLIKRVISNANAEGAELRPALFDMHFSGELMLAYKVFGFVCEANFDAFFVQGLALNEQRKLEAAAQSKMEEQSNLSKAKI